MISTRACLAIAAGTLLAGGLSAALAQPVPPERVYAFHSLPSDTCPSLDWHVVAEQNNTLNGLIATHGMTVVFRVTGTVAPNGTFHLDGKEVGGSGRTGTVDGQVRTDGWLLADIANITGSSPCNDHVIKVEWFREGGGVG
jgi:hypothetical protein